jgi:hypothetical protein
MSYPHSIPTLQSSEASVLLNEVRLCDYFLLEPPEPDEPEPDPEAGGEYHDDPWLSL